MTNEEEVILALKELKDWEGLPYCIEEPMQNEGIAVITKEALDKAIKALEVVKVIEDAYMSELLKTPTERNVPISDPCDGCQYELNSTNGNPCYSCGKYKLTEQQPCEDECVTKAEVIDTIHKTIYGFFDIADDDSEEPINDKDELLLTINKAISNAVKALPSVKPQRSRGKWIQTKDDCDGVNFYDFSFECSKCGKEQSFKSNYCPNCGAYMRGEDNDNK